jgi:hypothetical protein
VLFANNTESWWQRSEEYERQHQEITDARKQEESWEDAAYLLPDDKIDGMTTYEIMMHMGISLVHQNSFGAGKVGRVLDELGWRQSRVHSGPRRWKRKE